MTEREIIERALFLIAGEWGGGRERAEQWLLAPEEEDGSPTWWLLDLYGEPTDWAEWKQRHIAKPLDLPTAAL